MTTTKANTQIVKGKHVLTEPELVEVGKELSAALQNKEDLKEEASAEAAKYKDQIANEDKAIKEALDKIRTGEEDRDYKCTIERDYEQKQKNFVCVDSKRVIKTLPFTAADYQTEIGAGESPSTEETEKEEEHEEEEKETQNNGDDNTNFGPGDEQ